MHNGLGRTGYVLLAVVLLAVGALGLGATYYAHLDGTMRFFELGLALSAVGLVGLFGFAAWAPWLGGAPRPARRAASVPAATAAAPSAATPSPARTPSPGPDFEFNDAQPAAKAAPESLVMPQAFARETLPGMGSARDPTDWPERRGRPAGANEWNAKVGHRQRIEQMVEDSPVRKEMQERYTRTTPTVRGIMQDPPLHVAERAPPGVQPGFAAPGMSVGQCGRCQTVVMAPDARPIRLKCPQCAKVTLLN